MHSVCRCSLPVWRRSFLNKGTPVTYFGPALDPPLGGSGRKTTTLVRDHEYFIPTKFHQNLSSGSEEEVENVKVYRRTTTDDGRTDDGRCTMTIAHLSLWPRWAKMSIARNLCAYGSKWETDGGRRGILSNFIATGGIHWKYHPGDRVQGNLIT